MPHSSGGGSRSGGHHSSHGHSSHGSSRKSVSSDISDISGSDVSYFVESPHATKLNTITIDNTQINTNLTHLIP